MFLLPMDNQIIMELVPVHEQASVFILTAHGAVAAGMLRLEKTGIINSIALSCKE